jgi:DNA-binding MarR family transcriptional regulator
MIKRGGSSVFFAPIPARALSDQRLTARHFRVLSAVAMHDRFGQNGQGCWAGRKRLAQEAGCTGTHVSDVLTDLRLFGYIDSQPHPMNHRTRVHRIIYTDADSNIVASSQSADRSRKRDVLGSRRIADRSRSSPEQVPVQNARSLNQKEERMSNILGINLIRNSAEAGLPRQETNLNPAQIEIYLTDVEANLTSSDSNIRLSTRCERAALSQIAENEALPEAVRLRAATLRSAVEDGNF